jgi:hypothetical protein
MPLAHQAGKADGSVDPRARRPAESMCNPNSGGGPVKEKHVSVCFTRVLRVH